MRLPRIRRRGPRLKVHDPAGPDDDERNDLERRVDEILAKIHESGEASLTSKERTILEEASRRYKRR
jgi:hypothetical protein